MGNNYLAGAAISGAVGYAAGQKLVKGIQVKNFRKRMSEELINTYGMAMAIETFSVFESQGAPLDFNYVSCAERVMGAYLYRHLAKHYGEDAADFIEARMQKASEKGIKIDFDYELKEFCHEKNGIAIEHEHPVSDYLSGLKTAGNFDEKQVRAILKDPNVPPFATMLKWCSSLVFLMLLSLTIGVFLGEVVFGMVAMVLVALIWRLTINKFNRDRLDKVLLEVSTIQ